MPDEGRFLSSVDHAAKGQLASSLEKKKRSPLPQELLPGEGKWRLAGGGRRKDEGGRLLLAAEKHQRNTPFARRSRLCWGGRGGRILLEPGEKKENISWLKVRRKKCFPEGDEPSPSYLE